MTQSGIMQGGDFVPKSYSFDFLGTKKMFLNQLNKDPNNNHKLFYFDDYIVEISGDEIRFGIARGGHSGGYWFVPTITELDGKTTFCGTIEYVDPYTNEKGIKKTINKIEEVLFWIILIPVIIIVKVCLFFSWVVRKILKRTKPKEESLEDKLYNLMENHLGCKRQ